MTIHNALITGGTGFVGSNLVRRLCHDGWQVHIITRPNANIEQIKDMADQVTLHTHDGSTEGMQAIVAEAKPELVFHLASLFLSEHQAADISRLVGSNVLFGTQLLEAMASHGVTRFINTGTSWQHYENKSYSPVNLYAATKQAFEDILQYYVEAKGIQAITLKLFDTYGPNDPRPKLFHLLKRLAETGESLDMSSGEQMIDLVYIDDVIEAFVLAAKRQKEKSFVGYVSYAVSSGDSIKLKSLVELFCEVTGRPINVNWGGRVYRDREVMVPWLEKNTLPNWKPKIGLIEGFRKAI